MTPPTNWLTVPLSHIEGELRDFDGWVLCGGHSVALLTGKDTRTHGDIDIGVFRTRISDCLNQFAEERVYLCRQGTHERWRGGKVAGDIHDIWITDQNLTHWLFQIMIFDDREDQVFYRRNPRIAWSKKHHSVNIDQIRVLNPFVTFLFKANKNTQEEKEVHDLIKLIEGIGMFTSLQIGQTPFPDPNPNLQPPELTHE
ncbi:MAG: hypothetical protein EOP87_11290 [Verrucomicrobiaceae bacterium]|nr:MAG: hypothetical protein EOP87_11290 [Verrucomicrobiaceae bacterium]